VTTDVRILSAVQNAPARSAAPARPAASAAAPAEPRDSASISKATRADIAAPGKPEYMPGQVMVKFNTQMAANDVSALADSMGMKQMRHFNIPEQMVEKFGGELYQFKLKAGDTVEEAIKRLSGQPGVAYAEPNYKIKLDDPKTAADAQLVKTLEAAPSEVTPNDLDPRLWGIKNSGQNGGTAGVDVGASQAWATQTGKPNGQGPLICIIDTGLDYTHPELAANAWVNPNEIPGDKVDNDGDGIVDDLHGANLIAKTGDPMDDNDHGTHCAGTIGAVGNNGAGIVGVNWNATIASAKFLDAGGSGSYADAVDAVLYATRIGARVTSNSWGGGGFSQALYDAFKASPALHICAAGNESSNSDTSPSYPGGFDLDNIVSVAAIDRNGHLADFSNYGATSVDVAAPGVDIYSTQPHNRYQTLSGTSMATPHVSGVAGLVLSQYPDLTNEQLKARLVNTAVKEDELAGKVLSGGRVNAANALENDDVAPDTVGDLTVETAGASSMTLKFTATGDDGSVGTATAYQLRYSDQPITDQASWDAAKTVRGLPTPAAPGNVEHLTVPIQPDDQPKPYFFALRVADNLGNVSGTASTSATSIAAAVPFKDDFDTDNGNWTSAGGWGKVDVDGRGKVYTDSPNGAYPDNANTTLTSSAIDLGAVKNPRLLFSEKHDTEARYDFAHVEVSADGGKHWDEVAKYDGTSDWTDRNVDLKSYEGKSINVRFRMTSDGSIDKDGFYVDNLKIAGDPA
jgi:subtilisin family serine protease